MWVWRFLLLFLFPVVSCTPGGGRQLVAVFGLYLFQEARQLDRRPGPDNTPLGDFLNALWRVIAGVESTDKDIKGWEKPIKVARGDSSVFDQGREPQLLNARLDARHLISDLAGHESDLRYQAELDALVAEKS